MSDYESDFSAPEYTTIEKRTVGNRVITTVVLDGEVMEFESPLSTTMAAIALTTPDLLESYYD